MFREDKGKSGLAPQKTGSHSAKKQDLTHTFKVQITHPNVDIIISHAREGFPKNVTRGRKVAAVGLQVETSP